MSGTHQKHPVGVRPGHGAPARVGVVVLHTSGAAGVVPTAREQTVKQHASDKVS